MSLKFSSSSKHWLLVCFQARLRLSDVVEKEDVNEAMRLMEMSKDSLNPAHDMHSRYVPASILRKSTSGRQLPWQADDGPI